MIEKPSRRTVLTRVPLVWLATAAAATLDAAFHDGSGMSMRAPESPSPPDTVIDQYVARVRAEIDPPSHADNPTMAAEHAALFKLVPRAEATHISIRDGSWFDPNTWYKASIPGIGAKVLIPKDRVVAYDEVSDISLFTVRVDGHLQFVPDRSTKLKVDTLERFPPIPTREDLA